MVQTRSQKALQEQEPQYEYDLEEREGLRSSWAISIKETPWDENPRVPKYPFKNYLQDVRHHLTQLRIHPSSSHIHSLSPYGRHLL